MAEVPRHLALLRRAAEAFSSVRGVRVEAEAASLRCVESSSEQERSEKKAGRRTRLQFDPEMENAVQVLDENKGPLTRTFWAALRAADWKRSGRMKRLQASSSPTSVETAPKTPPKKRKVSADDGACSTASTVRARSQSLAKHIDHSDDDDENKSIVDALFESPEKQRFQHVLNRNSSPREIREFFGMLDEPSGDQKKEKKDKSEYVGAKDSHFQKLNEVSLTLNQRDPLQLTKWPEMIRKRCHVHKKGHALEGNTIIFWIRLGGFEGSASSCVRFEDNWALALCLWLQNNTSLPLTAVCFLPDSTRGMLESAEASNRTLEGLARDRCASFLEMREMLDSWNVPITGFFCHQRDITSIFASLTRKWKAHVVVTSESFSPRSLIVMDSIARAISCDLVTVDSDSILPPRRIECPDLSRDLHCKRIDKFLVSSLQEMEWDHFVPCLKPASKDVQKLLFGDDGKKILVPEMVHSRWKLIHVAKLNEWLGSEFKGRISESIASKHLSELQFTSPDDEFQKSQLQELLLAQVRHGTISPFKVLRKVLKEVRFKHLRDQILEADFSGYASFRMVKEGVFKPVVSKMADRNENRTEQLLSSDIWSGETPDHTWNVIQKRIVTSGVIPNEKTNAEFWVSKLLTFMPTPEQGLVMLLIFSESLIIGGQSPDFLLNMFNLKIGPFTKAMHLRAQSAAR